MRNKKAKIYIGLLVLFVMLHVVHWTEYFVKNYIYKFLPDKGIEREMKLSYVGFSGVNIEQSDIFAEDSKNYDEYTNCWQVLGIGDYKFFNKEIKLNDTEVLIGSCLFGNSYLISYGRKLKKAVYNTKDYWDCGYYVEFTFDETEYHSDVVYIYKTDRVRVGNIMYLM